MNAPSALLARRALFDPTGRYRYALERRWAPGGRRLAFILLNPSTADGERDDPTVRRCIGFARRWGFSSLEVVNLFALRATQPAALRGAADPVGPENDGHLLAAAGRADRVVLAWGIHGKWRGREGEVLRLLRESRRGLSCLGLTREGHPRHVLYLPALARPVPFPHA
jgi:hypothetical protein